MAVSLRLSVNAGFCIATIKGGAASKNPYLVPVSQRLTAGC
jgi:hypothetical protein